MADVNMEEMYRDQVVEQVHVLDRTISSFYTPEGIRRIDARFSRRILAFKNGKSYTEYSNNYSEYRGTGKIIKEIEQVWTDTYESIKKDLDEDVHLHPRIKKNLLFNLNRL